MVFVKSVTTVKDTLESSPLESFIDVARGLLYRSQIVIPPGPSGLVGIKIFEGGHQMFPVSRDEWLTGDNETVDFGDLYYITTTKTRLRILTYNLDDTYSHKLIVRLGVVVRAEFIAHFIPTMAIDKLQEVMEESKAMQELEAQEYVAAALASLPITGE